MILDASLTSLPKQNRYSCSNTSKKKDSKEYLRPDIFPRVNTQMSTQNWKNIWQLSARIFLKRMPGVSRKTWRFCPCKTNVSSHWLWIHPASGEKQWGIWNLHTTSTPWLNQKKFIQLTCWIWPLCYWKIPTYGLRNIALGNATCICRAVSWPFL